MGFHGALGGGGSYDDSAVLAAIADLEAADTALDGRLDTAEANIIALLASIQWNLNDTADGSQAGPAASFLVSNLSTTKRSKIEITWEQSGALTTSGVEFEPNDVAPGNGDSGWARTSGAGAGSFGTNTAAATVLQVIPAIGSKVRLTLYVDPVNKIGWAVGMGAAGSAPTTQPNGELTFMQWAEAAISSFRLNQLGASATMTNAAWKVWTENT